MQPLTQVSSEFMYWAGLAAPLKSNLAGKKRVAASSFRNLLRLLTQLSMTFLYVGTYNKSFGVLPFIYFGSIVFLILYIVSLN